MLLHELIYTTYFNCRYSPQISPEGILDDTTESAAIIELRPITVPGNNIVCAPAKTSSQISTVPSFVTSKCFCKEAP